MKKIEIDLHGVRHIDVENTVKRVIEANWDTDNVLVFITGHSPKMRKLVADEIRRYNRTPTYCQCGAKVMLIL